jgi:hypothetical protein
VNPIPGLGWRTNLTDLELYCDNSKCKKEMRFSCGNTSLYVGEGDFIYRHYAYTCKNCSELQVIYFIGVSISKDSNILHVRKIGEWPPLSHIPKSKLINLFGKDKDIYLKGRKCEYEGLGIGAFVYYRRIVEQKKSELFKLIIKALKVSNQKQDIIEQFQKAAELNSFKESVEAIKDIMPDGLKIFGYNPLTLLFKALSKGVHEMEDEECLRKSKEIRQIMMTLIEKVDQLSKDDSELSEAIKKLNS